MLHRSTCFKKVALLQISLFWTSLFSEKVTVLKNYLFSIDGCFVEVSLKRRCYSAKSNCWEKVTDLTKFLLQKSNSYEVLLFYCLLWRSRFFENVIVLKKLLQMREETLPVGEKRLEYYDSPRLKITLIDQINLKIRLIDYAYVILSYS